MRKLILISCICLLGGLSLSAQISIERQVLSSTGQLGTAGTIEISSTVGEAVVSTSTSGTLVLTQGFQQPDGSATTHIKAQPGLEISYQISPNPTPDMIRVDLTSPELIQLEISLIDLRGREVGIPNKNIRVEGKESFMLDLTSLADGVYHLVITQPSTARVGAVKIQKIH